VRGDVRDSHHVASAIAGSEIVFHLAALIAIPFSYEAPSAYVATNVQGTLNVLMAARDAGVTLVVHTSTSEVYGTAQFRPITEAHPLVGQSPYSASKIGADKIAESIHLSFGLPVVILRPFNTYGPRQSQRAVIPTTIRQAIDAQCSEIHVGNLAPERDFTFVGDTVRAFLAAAGSGARVGETYNAGTGKAVTIGNLVDEIVRVTGCNKPVVTKAQRFRPDASEVMALEADATRFHRATGWVPLTQLSEGLAATIEWWRSRPIPAIDAQYRL
jgi:nucleoside-diphosphate-sugar epimerase